MFIYFIIIVADTILAEKELMRISSIRMVCPVYL